MFLFHPYHQQVYFKGIPFELFFGTPWSTEKGGRAHDSMAQVGPTSYKNGEITLWLHL